MEKTDCIITALNCIFKESKIAVYQYWIYHNFVSNLQTQSGYSAAIGSHVLHTNHWIYILMGHNEITQVMGHSDQRMELLSLYLTQPFVRQQIQTLCSCNEWCVISLCCAEFTLGNKNTFIFSINEMAMVVEILPCRDQGLIYPTYSIPQVMMPLLIACQDLVIP